MRVAVINGPNLNLLGTREPEVYGSTTLTELDEKVIEWGAALGIEVSTFQSNHEGQIIDAIQDAASADGIILNPAAYTHTSRAIPDAVAAVEVPTVEVHISNVKNREPWRAISYVEEVATRTIYGRGLRVYRDALRHFANRARAPFETIAYGKEPDHVGDFRAVDGSPVMVVLVHGGLLLRQWERDTMETLAADLFERGYASWNFEYRRLGTGGGWPASVDDVTAAIEHSRQLSDRPIVAVGHSIGGLFVLTAQPPRGVDRTVALSPITDLAEIVFNETMGHEIAADFIEHGAPSMLNSVPTGTTLLHGARDEVIPHHQTERLAETTETVIFSDMGHFEMLDPKQPHWEHVLNVIEAAAG